MKAIYYFALILLFVSCSSEEKPTFTQAEKSQAHLLLDALNLGNKATQISNSGRAYTIRSQQDIDKMLALKEKAFSKVKQIPRNVLVKMHKDLPVHVEVYKQGLALEIDGYRNRNVTSIIKGGQLLDEWGTWLNANLNDIKVPKI